MAHRRGSGLEASAAGFAAALLTDITQQPEATEAPLLWCRRGRDLYLPGLAAFGFDCRRLVVVRGDNDREILWAMEEGLRSGLPAAVIGEVSRLPATALRRLQLAAEGSGVLALLLRPAACHVTPGPVATRWRVAAAASEPRQLAQPWPALAQWRVELLRCRGGESGGSWLVKWRAEHERHNEQAHTGHALPPFAVASAGGTATDRLAVVATLCDGPNPAPTAPRQRYIG